MIVFPVFVCGVIRQLDMYPIYSNNSSCPCLLKKRAKLYVLIVYHLADKLFQCLQLCLFEMLAMLLPIIQSGAPSLGVPKLRDAKVLFNIVSHIIKWQL